jgi:hypothetical protein
MLLAAGGGRGGDGDRPCTAATGVAGGDVASRDVVGGGDVRFAGASGDGLGSAGAIGAAVDDVASREVGRSAGCDAAVREGVTAVTTAAS